MNLSPASPSDDLQGQPTFGMANLRKERTGLPCIVFISQKDDDRHDVRVKIAPGPRMRSDQMSSYALRPFGLVEGAGLSPADERLLEGWVAANLSILIDYWDGRIEYTEDALDRLKSL